MGRSSGTGQKKRKKRGHSREQHQKEEEEGEKLGKRGFERTRIKVRGDCAEAVSIKIISTEE